MKPRLHVFQQGTGHTFTLQYNSGIYTSQYTYKVHDALTIYSVTNKMYKGGLLLLGRNVEETSANCL